MSGIGSRTIAQAMDDARAVHLLNDAIEDVYTDAVLLPVAALVIGEIQDELAKHEIPAKETTTQFSYVANATTISVVAATDFGEPLELWEKPVGSDLWRMMDRVMELPAPRPTPLDFLGVWEFSNSLIKVLECNVNLDIFCRYRLILDYPASAGATTGGERFYWALVKGMAFYAAGGTDRFDASNRFAIFYSKEIERVTQILSKGRQRISTRQQRSRTAERYPFPRVYV